MNDSTGCISNDSLTLRLVPYLKPYAGVDTAYCSGLSGSIGVKGITGFAYQWSPSEGLSTPDQAVTPIMLSNPSFENVRINAYRRTVMLAGCSASDTVQATVYPPVPRPVLAGPQFVCPGVQNVTYQLQTTPAVSNLEFLTFNFEVAGGDSTGRFTVNWGTENPSATATLIVGNVYGCQPDTAVFPVSITRNLKPQTVLTPGLNDSLCLASAQNVAYAIAPYNAQSRYVWHINPQTAGILDSTHNPSSITYNQGDLYVITLSEADTTPLARCFGKNDFPVRIWPQPTAKSILGEDSVCVNGGDQFWVMNYELNSQYNWSVDKGSVEDILPNGGKVRYNADFEMDSAFEPVQIRFTETSDKGCTGPESAKLLAVESLPKPMLTPPTSRLEWAGLNSKRYEVVGRVGSSFAWLAENGLIAGGQGTYLVTVDWLHDRLPYRLKVQETTRIGCLAETDWLKLHYDSSLYIPNLITPNGDGKNDRFEIKNLHLQPDSRLEIYDRWGRRVLDAEPYPQNWPESKLPAGTYFFFLRTNQTSRKGWIELVE